MPVVDISRPFIRLPYAFDAERLTEEVGRIPDRAWMAHPSRMNGNSAVALVSRGGEDNDEFEGRMAPSPHLGECEYLRQVMASFGEVLGRSRLMKLAAGAEVSTHVDFNYHWYTRVRIHIPVITHPGVTFFCADQALHMQAGEAWIFNSWRRHRVTNESPHDRVHLVLDTAGSSAFWRMVRVMAAIDLADRDAVEARLQSVPFEPGKQLELLTEACNIAPVMAPGEVDALVRELVRDFQAFPGNDPELVVSYTDMLTDFASDWRRNWLLHGYQQAGWARYQELVDGVHAALHPDRRALLTASNEVGVNPIIVQRILRAALATREMDQFTGASKS